MPDIVRAAAVQAEPVWFDAAGTTEKTIAVPTLTVSKPTEPANAQ